MESEEGFGLQRNGKNEVYGKEYARYSESNQYVNVGSMRVDIEGRKSPESVQIQRNNVYSQP